MRELPLTVTGLLRTFAEAGLIALPDVHLARRMARGHEPDERVVLACALAVRELRLGSVCLELSQAHLLKPVAAIDDGLATDEGPLPWPDPDEWAALVAASPLVGERAPFVFDQGLLYLARFHAEERRVADALRARRALPTDEGRAPLPGTGDPDPAQDAAVAAALRHRTTVITGGPGTGKTTTVVRVLDSLGAERPVSIALAAPTGKAARQLHDAVVPRLRPGTATQVPQASTLHRLLGMPVRGPRVQHDRANPLPHDVVVVDEVSMVSLEHMAALLDAVSDRTRLVLVGDPHQLRSVEAGAVLADIVETPSLLREGSVVELRTNHRSADDIRALAAAVHAGDEERALAVIAEAERVTWVDYDGAGIGTLEPFRTDVVEQGRRIHDAARRGNARGALEALAQHRVLCAHRLGSHGVQDWGRAARELVAREVTGPDPGAGHVGQPLLLTRNTDRFSNGDVAVVVDVHGELLAAVDQGDEPVLVAPVRLTGATDLHAMTVHKAQGGQFGTVTVVLPPEGSPLATRELLYTAITRARTGLRLYGTREALLECIRTPVRRASGLARR